MTIWYLARAAGLVALIAFTASTVLGALGSRIPAGTDTVRLDRRFLTQMAHRSAAVTGLLMLLTHVTLIVLDTYVAVSVGGALIPFTAGFRPLALGAGTIAVYLFVLVAMSGALRGRLATSAAAARRWRVVHLSAYAGWALSMGHGIFSGTDTGTWWSTAIYVACGLAVAIALVVRLRSERTQRSLPLTAARSLVRSSS
ncbi:ferric reductase [Aeromicrobium sp. A1-2]|uniref:ferric reductase n=1 Tax=Aeromicrobium sp. A1-2 TaxID=2107713 RepID=UPI0013C2B1BC|nr:ferric reductase [Aeromicrobium sp. A1-2]